MAIYLVQHGVSLPKEQDPEKGLSDTGIAETRRIAGVAKGYRVPVTIIFHSGTQRSMQTADIFMEFLKPPQGVHFLDGLLPLDDVAPIASRMEDIPNAMLVGHLPFMSRMTTYLITGETDRTIFQFQNSGIVCLEKYAETHHWVIQWTLMPTIGSP